MNLLLLAKGIEKRAENDSGMLKRAEEGNKVKDLAINAGAQSLGHGILTFLNGRYMAAMPDKIMSNDLATANALKDLALKNKYVDAFSHGLKSDHVAFFGNIPMVAEEMAKEQISANKIKKLFGKGEVLPGLEELKKMKGDELRKQFGVGDKVNNLVHSLWRDKPGVLAHEIGHAMDAANGTKMNNWVRRLSGRTASLSGTGSIIAALLGANDKTMLALGGVNALSHLPLMRDEFVASKNGYKLLRQLGKSRMKSLQAFGGVPAHAMSTIGLSFLPFGIKKLVDKIRGGKEKK